MTGASTAASGVVRRLTVLYGSALVLIGLVVLTYAVVREQLIIPTLQRASDVVETASVEDSSSQEITKAASALLLSVDRGYQAVYIAELRQALPAIVQDQAQLPGLVDQSSQAQPLLAVAEPHYRAFTAAVEGLLTVDDATQGAISTLRLAALQPYVVSILAEEQPLSFALQQIALRATAQADAVEGFEGTLDKGLLGSIWLALLLVGIFVFRPATRRVGTSMRELERTQELQSELAALKDQFIIDANHELRTPIMALYNTLELLSAVGQDGKPERRAQLVQRALTSGDTVLRLLTSVLDTSALEARAPKLALSLVPLETLIRAVLETFDPREIGEPALDLADDQLRSVTMNVSPRLIVWGDELRLRQVLINLISNALKYSGPRTPIQVSASIFDEERADKRRGSARTPAAEQPQRELVVVRVRDFGLGVPPHDAPKLFNRFVRLERDIAGSVRGTGVGLYVSRILVEAMGGTMWVESSGVQGEGSTFSFTAPLATPRDLSSGDAAPTSIATVTTPAVTTSRTGDEARRLQA